MPLQTRSKAAASTSDKPRASSREERESATREMQPSHSDADMSQRAEQPTTGGRIASSPIVGSLPEAPEYDSPRTRSRERNTRDTEGTEWQERGRTFRLPPASSQEHLFSPPPYQVRSMKCM
jgi:hypothetical protein